MEREMFFREKMVEYMADDFGITTEQADKIIFELDLYDEIYDRYKDDIEYDWQEEVDRAVEQQYNYERELDIHRFNN